MNSCSIVIAMGITAMFGVVPTAGAQTSTTDLLSAPRVNRRITITLVETAEGLTFDVSRDNEPPQDLKDGILFAAREPIRLQLRPFKPLKYAYSLNVEGFKDEAATDLATFAQGMLGFGTALRPDIKDLDAAAKSPVPLRTRAGASLCSLTEETDAADKAVRALSSALENEYIRGLESMFKQHMDAGTRTALDAAVKALSESAAGIEAAVVTAEQQLGSIRELRAKLQSEPACAAVARALFAIDSGGPVLRMESLRLIVNNLKVVVDGLRSLNRWVSEDTYQFSRDIVAQPNEGKKVSLTVAKRAFTVSQTAFVERPQGAPLSATFNLRTPRRLVPEIGAGFVYSRVKQPKYGTGKNAAGETVVTRADDETRSYDAALMLNLVCRCRMGGGIFPMLQFGVSADRDRPALLSGAGFRIGGVTGLKNVGFGVGGILAFPKDLTELRVGDPVEGTTQIEADLDFKPTLKGYFTIQFSF